MRAVTPDDWAVRRRSLQQIRQWFIDNLPPHKRPIEVMNVLLDLELDAQRRADEPPRRNSPAPSLPPMEPWLQALIARSPYPCAAAGYPTDEPDAGAARARLYVNRIGEQIERQLPAAAAGVTGMSTVTGAAEHTRYLRELIELRRALGEPPAGPAEAEPIEDWGDRVRH